MICSVSFLSRVCVSLLYVLCFVLVCFFGGLSQLMFRVYPRLYSVFHSIPFSILFYSILFYSILFYSVLCPICFLLSVFCFLFALLCVVPCRVEGVVLALLPLSFLLSCYDVDRGSWSCI